MNRYIVFVASCLCVALMPCLASIPSFAQTNIALNRAVYQSSSVDFDKCGHLTTDGSTTTYWQGQALPSNWLYIDLGSVSYIDAIAIEWGKNPGLTICIDVCDIDPEGDRWERIFSSASGGVDIISLTGKNVHARYVKLTVLSVKDASKGVSIREIRIFGKTGSPSRSVTPDLASGIWKIKKASLVNDSVENICSYSYDDSDWIDASVPGTILGAYVESGAVPEPFYADNMSMISEEFFNDGPFWYRTSFKTGMNNDRIRLNFDGINWKSEIFLNGRMIGETKGAFKRWSYDITDDLQDVNYLAVKVYPPDYPGYGVRDDEWSNNKVEHRYFGSPTTNGGTIGFDSPTFVASGGWNWMPVVRGRNTGIWNKVYLSCNGPVHISDPWVSVNFEGSSHGKAILDFESIFSNCSEDDIEGIFRIKIDGIVQDKHIIVPAHGQVKESQSLVMNHPELWWPNGYGDPYLYEAEVSFLCDDVTSDYKNFDVGVRDLECRVENNILNVYVNGVRIMLRGGNWGMAEAMLRCDAQGYETRVKLHRLANFNMIRNWVGQTAHREFYEACDRNGILIFDDFWLANPVDGPDPKDENMFYDNAIDKVRAVRSHPSVAFYCGRNEGYPPVEMDRRLAEIVSQEDPSRLYVSNSADGILTGLGPYDQQEAEWYFANRGITFHSELGIIAIPEAWSIRRFLPKENLWPINDMWALHDYQTPRSMKFTQMLEKKFGIPVSLDDYVRKAQMLTAMLPRAMYESLRSHQGSGILIWMSQAAWPSLICQMYDHYYEPTSAYFGIKSACEPLHIFLDLQDKSIKIANNTVNVQKHLTAAADIYALDGSCLLSRSIGISSIRDGRTVKVFDLPVPEEVKGNVFFVRLRLLCRDEVVSENFYWTEDADGSCMALNDLPLCQLDVSAERLSAEKIVVTLSNPYDAVTLMARLRLVDSNGDSILPVYYSDNYLNLLPSETKTIEIEGPEILRGVSVQLAGWNVKDVVIPVRD